MAVLTGSAAAAAPSAARRAMIDSQLRTSGVNDPGCSPRMGARGARGLRARRPRARPPISTAPCRSGERRRCSARAADPRAMLDRSRADRKPTACCWSAAAPAISPRCSARWSVRCSRRKRRRAAEQLPNRSGTGLTGRCAGRQGRRALQPDHDRWCDRAVPRCAGRATRRRGPGGHRPDRARRDAAGGGSQGRRNAWPSCTLGEIGSRRACRIRRAAGSGVSEFGIASSIGLHRAIVAAGRIALAALAGAPAQADDLREALVSAYQTNPTLQGRVRNSAQSTKACRSRGPTDCPRSTATRRTSNSSSRARTTSPRPNARSARGIDLAVPIYSGGAVKNSIRAAEDPRRGRAGRPARDRIRRVHARSSPPTWT